MAAVGATVVAGAFFASRPSVEEAQIQFSAATPNPLLAALASSGRDPYSSYQASQLAPSDASSAVTALIDGYTSAVDERLASGGNTGRIPLWMVGLGGFGGSAADAAWAADGAFDGPIGTAVDAVGTSQTVNRFGPLTGNFGNLGTFLFSQNPDATAPSGARPVFNAADLASWLVGLDGVGSSTGTTGWILNNTFGGGDGGIADATGLLHRADRFGPAFFNLDVLKYISFVQPANGTTLPDGQLDAIRAVDIGQWEAGIPGLITNSGATGFVTNYGYGVGFGTADYVGGLQTTTTIGNSTYTFNFLPAANFPPLTVTPNATSFDVNSPPAGPEMSALRTSDPQPAAAPSGDPAGEDAVTANATGPAGDGSPSTASTAATPPKTQEASGSDATEQRTPASRRTDDDDNAPRSRVADARSTDDTSDGGAGRHSAPDTSVGKHRADDGDSGRHRSDDDKGSNQSNDGANDSGSTE